MCDKQVGKLQENLQSFPKGMPKLVVQRAEEIFPALKENLSGTVLVNVLPDCPTGMCVSPCNDECEVISIKTVQNTDIEIKVEENPEPISFPEIKAEPDESCALVLNVLPGCPTGRCVSPCNDECEVISIKTVQNTDMEIKVEENPEPISFPEIKAEPDESCTVLVNVLPGCTTGMCVSPCNDECEVISIKTVQNTDMEIKVEENPEPISFPEIKAEPDDGTVNEQLQIHSGERCFPCEICNKTFNKKKNFIVHQRIHSGERPYSCSVCNKAFSQKCNLIKHQLIHSGERPYSCSVCNKAFCKKSNMITHQLLHSGERPYSCGVCNKAFSKKCNLITHQFTHSGEKPYTCGVCNKAFSQKNNLIIHQLTHSGERPYSCGVCNKTFSQKSNLITHQISHSGERQYSCGRCDKAFNQKGNLVRHQRIHSGQ